MSIPRSGLSKLVVLEYEKAYREAYNKAMKDAPSWFDRVWECQYCGRWNYRSYHQCLGCGAQMPREYA